MKTRPNVVERNLRLAKSLEDKNGELPSKWEMIQGGNEALYRYMDRHPDIFKDFKFKQGIHSLNGVRFNKSICDKHILEAKKLKKKFGSIFSIKLLQDKGYVKTSAYMKSHPQFFENI